MKKLVMLMTAILLLTSVSCAPPKEKFDPTTVTADSPQHKPFTPVMLSDSEYEKQAQILLVRLSDYVNTRSEIAYFKQFYEGICRYALVRIEPTGQRTNRWILFCYETNERELLTENASLVRIDSKDDITFLYTGFVPAESRYIFPKTVRMLRVNGEFSTFSSDAWLKFSEAVNLGPVTQDDRPLTGPVLQLLDDLHFTASGIQAVFRRSAVTEMQDPPYCEIRPDPELKTLTLTFTGATLGSNINSLYIGSDVSVIDMATVTQKSNKVIIELTLRSSELLYNFRQSAAYTVGDDLCSLAEVCFGTEDTVSQITY